MSEHPPPRTHLDAPLRSWREHLPAEVAPETLDLLARRSLPVAWVDRWRSAPDRVVLTDTGGGSMSAAQLELRSGAAAARLAAAGVSAGDRVVVSAAASLDYVAAYVGVLRLGAVAVPLNAAYREREVALVVGDALPKAAIVDDAERAAWIVAAAPDAIATTPSLRELPPPAATTLQGRLDHAQSADPALLVYTSGTTGRPKGALLSHGNLLASAEAVILAWRWTPDDRLVLALPLFHVHGLGVGLHGTLCAGASALLLERFEPGAVLEAIAAGGSLFFGVPTMWHRLAADPRAQELRRLRLGVSGSAPLPPDLFFALERIAGAPPLERYGMTETIMLVSNPYHGERRAGSVGFPLPGVELRLVEVAGTGEGAIDIGREIAREIQVRGPNVFAGYWQRPDANAEAFDEGWFRTGDLGAVDDLGYLRIVGRAKELIISGGFNVYPREIEDVLRSHPDVEDAAVVGLPDPEWGERVCACVVSATPLDEKALAAWCRERLAPYKQPRRWVRVETVPRNALGKIVRHVLVSRL